MDDTEPGRNDAERLRALLLHIYVSGAIRADMPDAAFDHLLTTILDAAQGRPLPDLGQPFRRD